MLGIELRYHVTQHVSVRSGSLSDFPTLLASIDTSGRLWSTGHPHLLQWHSRSRRPPRRTSLIHTPHTPCMHQMQMHQQHTKSKYLHVPLVHFSLKSREPIYFGILLTRPFQNQRRLATISDTCAGRPPICAAPVPNPLLLNSPAAAASPFGPFS